MKTNLSLLIILFIAACNGGNHSTEQSQKEPIPTDSATKPPAVAVSDTFTKPDTANPAVLEEPKPEPVSTVAPAAEKAVPKDATPSVVESALWVKQDPLQMPDLVRRVDPKKLVGYRCDYAALSSKLKGNSVELTLPTSLGMVSFALQNANTMNEKLAAKFPEIRSYKGVSADGSMRIRLDTNEDGLFAEITSTGSKQLLSPLFEGSKTYYALFTEDDLPPGQRDNTYY